MYVIESCVTRLSNDFTSSLEFVPKPVSLSQYIESLSESHKKKS